MLWLAYSLIGGAMVGWGEGWVVGMGYVFLLGGGISLLLYPVCRSGDLAVYSYGGYVFGTMTAWFCGLLDFGAFSSEWACSMALLGGLVFSLALPLPILLIGDLFVRSDS